MPINLNVNGLEKLKEISLIYIFIIMQYSIYTENDC